MVGSPERAPTQHCHRWTGRMAVPEACLAPQVGPLVQLTGLGLPFLATS